MTMKRYAGLDVKVISNEGLRQAALCWMLAVLIMLVAGCGKEKSPLKIGFAGSLTGRYSDLGTSGRNGATLAVEEINAAGGIHGRPVELIVRDDQQNPEIAVQVDNDLIQKGVVAIIGHMTSDMAMAAVPLMNQKGVLMISPTVSTTFLSGKDDDFIRVTPALSEEPKKLADYARKGLGVSRMAIICDMANRTYTEDYADAFKSYFENMGGHVTATITFTHGVGTHFGSLAHEVAASGCEGVLIAAGALDAGMICQQLHRENADLHIFCSGWAMTQDFIQSAGRAADGVMFAQFYDQNSRKDTFTQFKKRFEARFGANPDFAAVAAYDAAQVLFAALSQNLDPQMLKATILKQKSFHGVEGDFEIDAFGDPIRRFFLITVADGRFKTLE